MISNWIYSNVPIWTIIVGCCVILLVIGYALWAAVKQDELTFDDEIGK